MGVDYAEDQGPDDISMQNEWPQISSGPQSLEAALAQAEISRSELSALDYQLEAAQAQERYAARSNRPDLDSYFRYGADNNTFEEGEDMRTGWTVGLVLNWTLIDLGDRKSQVKQARSQQEELAYQRQAIWLQIEQQLRQAWYAKDVAEAILKSAKVNVEQAKEALKLATESLSNGRATQLDVLQAELALTQAKLQRHTAEHDRLAATVRLVYAMGTE
jgi:outer membrane protein TolC